MKDFPQCLNLQTPALSRPDSSVSAERPAVWRRGRGARQRARCECFQGSGEMANERRRWCIAPPLAQCHPPHPLRHETHKQTCATASVQSWKIKLPAKAPHTKSTTVKIVLHAGAGRRHPGDTFVARAPAPQPGDLLSSFYVLQIWRSPSIGGHWS